MKGPHLRILPRHSLPRPPCRTRPKEGFKPLSRSVRSGRVQRQNSCQTGKSQLLDSVRPVCSCRKTRRLFDLAGNGVCKAIADPPANQQSRRWDEVRCSSVVECLLSSEYSTLSFGGGELCRENGKQDALAYFRRACTIIGKGSFPALAGWLTHGLDEIAGLARHPRLSARVESEGSLWGISGILSRIRLFLLCSS